MPDLEISSGHLEAPIDRVASDVETQRALLATMRFDNSRLQRAFALLKQMEQRLTIAELDCAFIRVNSEQCSL